MHLTTDKSWALRENDDPATPAGGGLPAVKGCEYVREEAVGGRGVEAAQPVADYDLRLVSGWARWPMPDGCDFLLLWPEVIGCQGCPSAGWFVVPE